ncbi:MAG: cysteine synthase family protein [Deltaproteobacteria bacterium]|nr:cysteine synthase family protein [Deltaproteobacteria bacterium]MBI2229741.1 cysteine synthase family protein [Deltaproteobacteria bacterium]MBI2366739.1 cysteine synthase family protein [Deltaproteobacteria bacterium]MBI2531513.1 cysteine synthase family protein [Deltaproteobacteria bacterium]
MTTARTNLRLVSFPASEPKKVESVLDLIGDTPLLEIQRITEGLPAKVHIFAKLEGFNPGGSVKDRPALWMVREGIRTGKLRPGKIILDSTSGNTGIALALIGSVLGYRVELVMPANVSAERKQIIHAYGAKVIYSDPMEGSDGAILLCRKILAEEPEKYFKPDQYFNPMNPQAHYETTGPEIYRQTDQSVTHLVAGIGTGGTIMGMGRYLKEMNPSIKVIAVEPDDALHGLEGLKHMASSIVPGIYHEDELDEKIPVSTDDAYAMVYRLSQEEGVVVGQSSGAALFAAIKLARRIRSGTIVTVFPDFGDKYLSTNLWVGWRDRMAVGKLKFSI